jgi:glycosyltransferase involved in cell wall biosynthesis
VVPVYNGRETLDELVERIVASVGPVAAAYEILLVNDGSADGSWDRIVDLARRHPAVRGINLMRNFGQHNATLAGIRESTFAVVVTLDDDLQHPPEAIPRLIERLDADTDVVYGSPLRPEHGVMRGVVTYVTKLALQNAIGSDVARKVNPFRAFHRDLRDAFESYSGPYVSIDVLLSWGASRFAFVEFEHRRRATGQSNYTFRGLVTYALNLLTGFSTRPLRLASLVGFTFALLGVAILAEVLLRRLIQGNPVPGFPFLASIVAIFSGAQLFALGIIGEYLARMYFRVIDKPPYAVRSRTGTEQVN